MGHKEETEVAVLLLILALATGQRVAPGVPPQHYQQVPPVQNQQQQQYKQPSNAQQQQVPVAPGVGSLQYHGQVQHQQMPVQQQQQYEKNIEVPQVQSQKQQTHGHLSAQGQPQQVLNVGNLDHERVHIQEHMQVPIDTSKMSDAELQFHYFKIHDSDNNNKLDGCELIKSLIHWHEQGSKESHNEQATRVEEKVFSDEELVALIDPILQMDDISRDGYIDYPEFIKAQQKAAASNFQQKQQQPQT